MAGLLQSLFHITSFSPTTNPPATSSPFLSTFVPAIASSAAVQVAFGLPSILQGTDLCYDLGGGFGHYATLATVFVVPALRAKLSAAGPGADRRQVLAGLSLTKDWDWRQVALTGANFVWAARLSTYLFVRVLKTGKDSRLDKIKNDPRLFAIFWAVQAIWVILCCLPVLAVDSIPLEAFKSLPSKGTATDKLGLILFLFGFVVENVADYQKSRWLEGRRTKVHDELFMTRGLWGRSRYPNYFGEITLWTGIATTAAGILVREPVQSALGWNGGVSGYLKAVLIPALAPAFSAYTLLKVSGIPISERKYDRLYGGREDYEPWRRGTPKLLPRVF